MLGVMSTEVREYCENGLNYIVLKNDADFDTKKTFDCGQCFRFERVYGKHECEYAGVANRRFFSVAQDGDLLYIYNVTAQDFHLWLGRYLGFDEDYKAIREDIFGSCDLPVLKAAADIGRGIRILRQESWEALCSFMISQNNNIPRIKKIIARLCEKYGEPVSAEGMEAHGAENATLYTFPSAETLYRAGEEELKKVGMGFRAKYIMDAAEKIASGKMDPRYVNECSTTAEAEEYLCTIKGVGPKVASCALLFGFGRFDTFPIDVWISRVLDKYFDRDFDPLSFGKYAGIVQQYLFYYERYIVSDGGR